MNVKDTAATTIEGVTVAAAAATTKQVCSKPQQKAELKSGTAVEGVLTTVPAAPCVLATVAMAYAETLKLQAPASKVATASPAEHTVNQDGIASQVQLMRGHSSSLLICSRHSA